MIFCRLNRGNSPGLQPRRFFVVGWALPWPDVCFATTQSSYHFSQATSLLLPEGWDLWTVLSQSSYPSWAQPGADGRSQPTDREVSLGHDQQCQSQLTSHMSNKHLLSYATVLWLRHTAKANWYICFQNVLVSRSGSPSFQSRKNKVIYPLMTGWVQTMFPALCSALRIAFHSANLRKPWCRRNNYAAQYFGHSPGEVNIWRSCGASPSRRPGILPWACAISKWFWIWECGCGMPWLKTQAAEWQKSASPEERN